VLNRKQRLYWGHRWYTWCSRSIALGPGAAVRCLACPCTTLDLTNELAYNSSPPMGANMMPTTKKRGRTVFGVRIGLSPRSQCRCPGPYTFIAHILPRLQSLLSKRSVCKSISVTSMHARRHPGLLGGRLLFVFLPSSRLGSWLDIEALGSICCVCDMLGKSALFRSDSRGRKSRSCRALTTRGCLRTRADQMLGRRASQISHNGSE